MNIKEMTPAEAEKIMQEFEAEKRSQLIAIDEAVQALNAQIEADESTMKTASEELDAVAYKNAAEDKALCEIKLTMYADRLNQIQTRRAMDQEQSDAVLGGLILHEAKAADDFEHSIVSALKRLKQVLGQYLAEVDATESTLRKWQYTVRPNYYSFIVSDGKAVRFGTRDKYPHAVHTVPFRGVDSARELKNLLDHKTIRNLIN